MRPQVEQLEDRNCPSPLAVPSVAPPPAGYQVIVGPDLANQNPMFLGLAGFTKTLAEPNGLPTVPMFGRQIAVQQQLALEGAISAPSTITVIPGDAWYVENALLPEGFVPGTTVPAQPAKVSPQMPTVALQSIAAVQQQNAIGLSADAGQLAQALGIVMQGQ